jgi:signal transduction histidine kinase
MALSQPFGNACVAQKARQVKKVKGGFDWFLSRRRVPTAHRLRGYLVAILSVAVALATRALFNPLLGHDAPYVFFSPALLIAAWVGGFGPGMLALVLGFLGGDFFFSAPQYQIGPYTTAEVHLIIDYFLGGATGVFLFHLLHRSNQQIERAAARLAAEVQERHHAEEALSRANDQLEAYASDLEVRVAERTASLRHSLRSMEDLLYTIAHHLRAPSRALAGFSHVLLEQYATKLDSQGVDYLDRIIAAAARNDALIADLLEFGRLSHTEMNITGVSVRTVTRRVLESLRSEIEEAGTELQVNDLEGTVAADEQALILALRHMLLNAIKFAKPGRPPCITISVERENGETAIAVCDKGIGIAPEYYDRIFHPFEKLGESAGTGMGLALVKMVAERLHGRVAVSSKVGVGTKVTFALPTYPDSKARRTRHELPGAPDDVNPTATNIPARQATQSAL